MLSLISYTTVNGAHSLMYRISVIMVVLCDDAHLVIYISEYCFYESLTYL